MMMLARRPPLKAAVMTMKAAMTMLAGRIPAGDAANEPPILATLG
jgi:hypothetical protein